MERMMEAVRAAAGIMWDAYPGICILAMVVLAVFILIVVYSMAKGSGE